jgi:TonB family protein
MTDNYCRRNLGKMFAPRRPYDEIESGTDNGAAQSAANERETRHAARHAAPTDWLKNYAAWSPFADPQVDRQYRRYAAVAIAVVLNALFVWIVIGSLRFSVTAGADEIHLVLTPFTRADVAPLPRIPEPTLPVVEMPEIAIQTEAPTTAPATASASVVLAPRPDPAHPNPLPSAAEIGAGSVAATVIVLKIMVLPDGSVNDAVVVKSSGQHDTDLAAIAFVKAQWRFLPALIGSTAIQYWTTVSLRTA